MLGRRHTQSATGVITLVQEQRFQLAADGGEKRLFVLAHEARLDSHDLRRLSEAGLRVAVQYEDAVELVAHVAHEVHMEAEP